MYGYRKIHSDLQNISGHCGLNRVHRPMQREGLRAQVGYRRPRHHVGETHVVLENKLNRQFDSDKPDQAWVTDITYIRTHEG